MKQITNGKSQKCEWMQKYDAFLKILDVKADFLQT